MTTGDTATRDAALLPPSLRQSMIAGYEALAEANAFMGYRDLAATCLERAAVLASEGTIQWGDSDAGN